MVVRLAEDRRNAPGMELWDKRVLPYEYWPTHSYTIFQNESDKIYSNEKNLMKDENEEKKENISINPKEYKQLLDEEVEENESNAYNQFESKFNDFLKPISSNLSKLTTGSD